MQCILTGEKVLLRWHLHGLGDRHFSFFYNGGLWLWENDRQILRYAPLQLAPHDLGDTSLRLLLDLQPKLFFFASSKALQPRQRVVAREKIDLRARNTGHCRRRFLKLGSHFAYSDRFARGLGCLDRGHRLLYHDRDLRVPASGEALDPGQCLSARPNARLFLDRWRDHGHVRATKCRLWRLGLEITKPIQCLLSLRRLRALLPLPPGSPPASQGSPLLSTRPQASQPWPA